MKRKIKSHLFALVIFVTLVGCSTTQPRGLVDENILVKLPIPDSGWAIRSGERGADSLREWQKNGEFFKITIYRDQAKPEPSRFMLKMNKAAKQNFAADLESKELKQGLVNNYPMILWQTKATLKSGSKTLNLLLYIKGNDATYLIQKRWDNLPVSDAEKQLWIDYLLSISVCDNRFPEHHSPKMEEQWPGLYYNSAGLTNRVKQ